MTTTDSRTLDYDVITIELPTRTCLVEIMSKAASARSKFAELRALRESGKKRLETYEVQQEADVYEELDEDGYKKLVRERLNQDDFVIDDNGEGYADDGREEWDRPQDYTDSEDDLPTAGKNTKAGMSTLPAHE